MAGPTARWFERVRSPRFVIAIALALALPAALMPPLGEDYLHLSVLRGSSTQMSRWSLFEFASGDETKTRWLIEHGPWPWWITPSARVSFLRPLSSALANVDYALFGERFALYHLHSVLWYGALVASVLFLLRRIARPATGAADERELRRSWFIVGTAALLFAIDGGHWVPITWVANRNALLAGVFALVGLRAHIAWREDGRRWGLPASLLAFALSMASGEIAFSALAYVPAYVLVLSRERWRERIVSIVPGALLFLAYVACYRLTRSGASGTTGWADPSSSPGIFLALLVPRFFANASGLPLFFPVDFWILLPQVRPLQVFVALLGIASLALVLRTIRPTLDESEWRQTKWALVGAALGLLPVLASPPNARLLLMPSFGMAFVLATILATLPTATKRWARVARGVIIVTHAVLPLLMWPFQYGVLGVLGSRFVTHVQRGWSLDDPALANVAIVAAPGAGGVFFAPFALNLAGRPFPERWWTMSVALADHRITRVSNEAVEIELIDGVMLATESEQMLGRAPLTVGSEVRLSGATIRVLDAKGENPTRLRLTFDRPPEELGFTLASWENFQLVPLDLSKVGASVIVRKPR